ncbi:alpha-hydroxy acid oxidase [Rhodopila sp.]|jgi:L-lactate dehydrogenase (cytochrome)/(S)-mandelate dehydrogenase|uniref:alpha-hydroxy acid oxidase n=1 Tax=Rhodopila sp. TaxID=2480087 RepID=UPI002B583B27|nr:alpha-hydroxy acid oxidase [Rhodopila sp.]HVZ09248.1 alpha-hydroxy acid oxidase [Rhodopila sp.]
MSRIDSAINIDDLKRMAKRRLPKIMFDFIEGGVEDEVGLRTNAQVFRNVRLVPRYYINTSKRSQKAKLFGREFASPFGIAPTGMAGAFRKDAELFLSQAANDADVPYLMSGASNASMEQGAKLAPRNLWYQIYGAKDRSFQLDLVKRAKALDLSTIAVTCDVPVSSNRERNRRNGFVRPLKMTLPTILEAMLHPEWVINYFRNGGLPMLGNWQPYAPRGSTPDQVADVFAAQTPDASQVWEDLDAIRQAWPGKLLVKGIMHPEDARQAIRLGVDGIIVSNHGARQLDNMPSPIDVLPMIRTAVGPDVPLLLDSGVRRGSDIVSALCLGADFVLTGRATLYGATAGGLEGVRKAISILQREIDLVMGQIGAVTLQDLGPHYLLETVRAEEERRNSGAMMAR